LFAGVEDFQRVGVDVCLATDDGSKGHHGLASDLLTQVLEEVDQGTHVVCCGPEPMMKQVAKITQDRDISCQVSMETPMACGIGICFTCVARVRDARGDWDYRRTCVEGPVFDARQIVW
jgi:dihydroorotate dehydrogenase electron transfer subunit